MQCEFLTLADGAQVQGDRILILGRGWRCLTTGEGFPFEHHLGVAASLVVGGIEALRRHHYSFRVAPDGFPADLVEAEGDFGQDLPAGTPLDDDRRLLLAANLAPRFERAGPYTVQVLVDGEELARTSFTVIDEALAPVP